MNNARHVCALLCYIYTTTAHDAHCTLTQASINCRLIPSNYKHDGYVVLSVLDYVPEFVKVMTSNGNKTECSPIRSVIIRVITKSDNRVAGVRFVYHECDCGQNIGRHKVIQITTSEKEKNY